MKNEDFNFDFAVAVSSGYELVQRKKFALDLQSKLHPGRAFSDNNQHRDGLAFTIDLGFTGY